MSLYVVDASAAIKWILPEPAWDDALRIAPRFTDPAGFPLLDASLVTRESFAKGAQPRQSSAGCPLVPSRRRDRDVNSHLRKQGWTVLRFWEHSLRSNPHFIIRKIRAVLSRSSCCH